MKAFAEWFLLSITLVVISLLPLLIQINFGAKEKSTPPQQSQVAVNKVSPGLPVLLTIPIINVNANIQQLGVTSTGEMDIPDNTTDAGWFKFGSRPGEKGSAVIAGHFNGINDQSGVFFNLYQLKKGDKIYIKDDKGATIAFVVRESRIYDPGYADEVFSKNDGIHLNLITCDGVWDGVRKSYTKRLVIFADIEN